LVASFGFGEGDATGVVIFGASTSAGAVDSAADAKACRNGAFKSAVGANARDGSSDVGATLAIANRSCLLSAFETGPSSTGEAISNRGTLARSSMLAAATPATRKQDSAMMAMVLVKLFSDSVDEPRYFPDNRALIKA
jgi:hypothetical protein